MIWNDDAHLSSLLSICEEGGTRIIELMKVEG